MTFEVKLLISSVATHPLVIVTKFGQNPIKHVEEETNCEKEKRGKRRWKEIARKKTPNLTTIGHIPHCIINVHFLDTTCVYGGGILPYVGGYQVPVNRPPFYADLTPNDPVFFLSPHPMTPFCTLVTNFYKQMANFCAFVTHFEKFWLEIAFLHTE